MFLDMEEGHGMVLLLGTLHGKLHFLNIHSLLAWGQHRQDSRVIKGVCCVRYRSLLAEKLLGKTDYECDREIRTLELLKLRFGEANLHNCEVGRELPPALHAHHALQRQALALPSLKLKHRAWPTFLCQGHSWSVG